MTADSLIAGAPLVLFDAAAVILSETAAKGLSHESGAVDFVRDAYEHLKAVAFDKGGQAILSLANIKQDAGVVNAAEMELFIAAAKTRQWDREKSVRVFA